MLKSAPFYASVPVRDIERARRFYEDTLDLGPGEPMGPALAFRCGQGTSCLMYPAPGAAPLQLGCAFWKVEDIRAVMEWLRSRGVEFVEEDGEDCRTVNGVLRVGDTRVAWFRDSESNLMAVIEGHAH